MTTPANTRPFSLEMAMQQHPLITRDGKPANFIVYVPEASNGHNVLVLRDKNVLHCFKDGQ